MSSACCSPSSDDRTTPAPAAGDAARVPAAAETPEHAAVTRGASAPDVERAWCRIEASSFLMGSEETLYPADAEGPVREVSLGSFEIAPYTVTNADWSAFVAGTGYRTISERLGSSFVFGGLLPDDFPPTQGVAATPWWRLVEGASWDHPEGPQSDLSGRDDHPVVHVAWLDAVAYCDWSDTRLPNEAEWECAARGGLVQQRYPWGDEREPDGRHRMNVFQGEFPGHDTGDDGFIGTAPVGSYEPNGHGLYDVCGNVWEWCDDWFSTTHPTRRVMRGGSYLCHESYCWRYRVSARSSNTPDSAAGNIGFRVVR